MTNDLPAMGTEPVEVTSPQIRVQGPASAETLIYLPGVHGDWTLISGFAGALAESVRLVQITYPRALSWSLADYACNIESTLAEHGIRTGWLLGESFGSQIVWEIVSAQRFRTKGVILAGGFARHPVPLMASLAAWLVARSSFKLLTCVFRGYVRVSRARFRRSPEVLASLTEFLARRTRRDCLALQHRLALVAGNDPRCKARGVTLPVFTLTGFWDPIVPWYPARRWLQRNCPAFQGHHVIWQADHNVLGTAPRAAASQVLKWMIKRPESDPGKRND
jgi:pimeloyl-ACP methyl ester carboxylesterase